MTRRARRIINTINSFQEILPGLCLFDSQKPFDIHSTLSTFLFLKTFEDLKDVFIAKGSNVPKRDHS